MCVYACVCACMYGHVWISCCFCCMPSGELWWLFLRVLAVKLRKPQAGVSMWMLVKGRYVRIMCIVF